MKEIRPTTWDILKKRKEWDKLPISTYINVEDNPFLLSLGDFSETVTLQGADPLLGGWLVPVVVSSMVSPGLSLGCTQKTHSFFY